jgi:hypothetical protein
MVLQCLFAKIRTLLCLLSPLRLIEFPFDRLRAADFIKPYRETHPSGRPVLRCFLFAVGMRIGRRSSPSEFFGDAANATASVWRNNITLIDRK